MMFFFTTRTMGLGVGVWVRRETGKATAYTIFCLDCFFFGLQMHDKWQYNQSYIFTLTLSRSK